MQTRSPVVYPVPVYFTHRIEDGVLGLHPKTVMERWRSITAVLDMVLTDNYLLMDLAAFHAYNGNFKGSAVVLVSDDPTALDLLAYGKGNVTLSVHPTIDAAIDWIVQKAESTRDPNFYVLMDPVTTQRFEPYAFDVFWFELEPTESFDTEQLDACVPLTLDLDHWLLNCTVKNLPTLEGAVSVRYYGSLKPLNIKDRDQPL